MPTRKSYLSLIAVALALTACSSEQPPPPDQSDTSEDEASLFACAGVPLFDGMGDYHRFPTMADVSKLKS